MADIEGVEFIHESGEKKDIKVTVYALSTCGFCRRGLAFLRDNSVEFEYVYVDHLPLETKNKVKDVLAEKYKERVAFPFVILNGKEVMVGFSEIRWKDKLNL